MAGLTNRSGVLGQVAAAPSMMVADVAAGGRSLADLGHQYGVSPVQLAALNPGCTDLCERGWSTVTLPAQPIPPYVVMTSPAPAFNQEVYGTGWLGATSQVQGTYAGQPLSTHL